MLLSSNGISWYSFSLDSKGGPQIYELVLAMTKLVISEEIITVIYAPVSSVRTISKNAPEAMV